MQDREKIGIVLATYNPNIQYFQKQIHSIQNQTYQNWVCHIVDDCSRRESQDAITKVIADDPRFICHFHSHNLNHYYNFERGLDYCSQDQTITAIAFCDQDDIWQAEKLTILLEKLRSEQALLVHSDLEMIDSHDQTINISAWNFEGRNPEKLTAELLLIRNSVTGCALLFCTSLLPNILPFPQQDKANWHHDWWVAIVAAQMGKIEHIRQPLVRYRLHGSNTVGVMQDAGMFYRELIVWFSKKLRITGKSYLTHRNLSQAFQARFQPQLGITWCNPFDDRRLDFGLGILKLGYKSVHRGYGSEGIALRIWFCKVLFDLKKIRKFYSP